ncbi:DUF4355 domain-containing protein [Enterococcus hulanensis]|uniref:DUF4355 domain-containing protein n=1 Tax=Enterococcus TaxID=1350 RepID=UPI000B66317F|nr:MULTISPECIES: DUF4355 domain-containing protein [Enterococcus]MBO0413219.1 DUF4355 domain-containing protein [Enterococcus hulanensis]OTO15114.1 hypothetical protein A5875_004271 [Enterococcus sp. 3H8_DIV0648]
MKDFILKKCEQKMLQLDLQLFADGDGGGGDGGSGDGNAEPISFANQSELDSFVDKRVAKSLETAQSKWKTEQQEAIEAAKSEAAKMAQMTAEEKAQMAEKKKQEAEEERLADITRRELRLEAFETLTEKNLPKELIDAVVLTDAESCKKSIEGLETAFRSAVEAGVNERLAASANTPPANSSNGKIDSIGSKAAKAANERTAPKTNLWS